MTLRRTRKSAPRCGGAKATLDQLDFYPEPVDIAHVRILHVPWLFRLPWFRRFHGYEMGPLILSTARCTSAPGLIAHELCHVWQDQDHRLRMWWSYLRDGYATNRHEIEARRAAAARRARPPWTNPRSRDVATARALPAGLTRPARVCSLDPGEEPR